MYAPGCRAANGRFVRRCLRALALGAGLASVDCSGELGPGQPSDVARYERADLPIEPEVPACALLPLVPAFLQHCGDVTIRSQADADQYQNASVILGNLTLLGGHKVTDTDSVGNKLYKPGLEITLPNLVQVTGSLDVDGDRSSKIDLPNLARVGGDLTVKLRRFVTFQPPGSYFGRAINTLLTPALTAVGGDISLRAFRDEAVTTSSWTKQYEFGLDQIASVGRHVVIEAERSSSIQGLRGLTSIPGSLSIDWKNTDLEAQYLLTSVTKVGGSVKLLASSYARRLMPKLQQIEGDLEIGPSLANDPDTKVLLQHAGVFPKLAKVLGNVRLTQTTPANCENELRSLKKVGGSFVITGTDMSGQYGVTGGTSLQLGGLDVQSSTGSLPFFPDLRLTASASVSFVGNPALCPCTIDAFAAQLAASGWTGTVTSSGNGGAECTSCPAACP